MIQPINLSNESGTFIYIDPSYDNNLLETIIFWCNQVYWPKTWKFGYRKERNRDRLGILFTSQKDSITFKLTWGLSHQQMLKQL